MEFMDKPHLNLYFREIVYHNPSKKGDSICGVFSYEALNIEETNLGNLYLTGKISNIPKKKHKNYDFLLGVLISVIKREFYLDHQKGTVEALESALQSANIYLDDFAKKGHKEWIKNIDFTCFAFSQNNIHIGQTGNMLVYLFRKNTMTNIARKFSNKVKSFQPSKTFANIASGNLEEDDKIIITTPDILEIISTVKIKQILSQSSTEELFNYLKKNLKKVNSLACLILEAKSKEPIIKKEIPVKIETKLSSIDLERILNSKSNKFNNVIKTKIHPDSKAYKIIFPLLKYHIPKYFLALFLLLIIILSPYIVQKIYYKTKTNQIDNLIIRSKEIINKSELSLIYQNQTNAQALLQQANALIATAKSLLIALPELVKQKPNENIESIQQNLDIQKNSINNVINISQPEVIADLSKNSFTFAPRGILKLEENLYLYELSSGFIYKIDLNDLDNPTLIFLSSKDTFKLGAVKENAIVLLSNPEKVYVYATNDNYNTYLLKPDVENTIYIKDMTHYNGNFYLLDTERLDILKYIPQENSLNGTSWLDDRFKQDLIDAQSITIDGSIYVSKLDGTIIEFVSGRKNKEFKPDISPKLLKGSQIFTKPDMKKLYVLDPENNRIISINKSDNQTIQYISPEFSSLSDLWVTQDEKNIYLLDGLKIYKIDI